MRSVKASDRHEQLRMAIVEAVRPFDDIPAIEQLCVLAVLCGQLIALQDSTKYSAAGVMEVFATNVELGNANALTAAALGIIKP